MQMLIACSPVHVAVSKLDRMMPHLVVATLRLGLENCAAAFSGSGFGET